MQIFSGFLLSTATRQGRGCCSRGFEVISLIMSLAKQTALHCLQGSLDAFLIRGASKIGQCVEWGGQWNNFSSHLKSSIWVQLGWWWRGCSGFEFAVLAEYLHGAFICSVGGWPWSLVLGVLSKKKKNPNSLRSGFRSSSILTHAHVVSNTFAFVFLHWKGFLFWRRIFWQILFIMTKRNPILGWFQKCLTSWFDMLDAKPTAVWIYAGRSV